MAFFNLAPSDPLSHRTHSKYAYLYIRFQQSVTDPIGDLLFPKHSVYRAFKSPIQKESKDCEYEDPIFPLSVCIICIAVLLSILTDTKSGRQMDLGWFCLFFKQG